jgi:ectoine hydroxylase-related dioxygenase (phytanoyl-CoA dioxygenase family)
MEKYEPFFDELSRHARLHELVARLVEGEPELAGVETFNKPARTGSGVPPHQDNAYFCLRPPNALTVWIALDAATRENGPITYLSGSHVDGLLPHQKSGVSGNSMGLARMPEKGRYPEVGGILEPGDLLIHHCETIHFSAPNRSAYPRCGLLLVYRNRNSGIDPDLKKDYSG